MRQLVVLLIPLMVAAGLLFSLTGGLSGADDSYPDASDWMRLGGPLGGLGYDIRVHPDDSNIMYVTDAWAGIHKSTDGGYTWANRNEGINLRTGPSGDAVPVFCATIDPNDPDIIWAGLQGQAGIYRSDDGGETWERRTNGIVEGTALTVRGITIEPGDSDVVYAAAEVSSWYWNGQETMGEMFDLTKGVVYRSSDAGLSWEAIWRGDNLARYVWIDPRDHDVLFVSTGIFDREAANTDVEAGEPGGVGVLKSTDGGKTWKVLDEDNGLTGLYVGSLFMHPENPDIILAGAGHDYWSRAWDQDGREISPAGVYITTDGGDSWTKTASADLISAVEYSVTDPSIAYAAGDHYFFRSEDGGFTWQRVGYQHGSGSDYWGPDGIVAGFPIDIQCDLDDPMRLFVNNYGGGNFLSVDGGETWVDASSGYTGAQVRHLAVDPANPARIYAGGRSGTFRSHDGGSSWTGLAFPPARHTEITALASSPLESNLVISAPWDLGNLARSVDGGLSWSVVPVPSDEDQQFLSLVFAPTDHQVVYAGAGQAECKFSDQGCARQGGGVYVSVDAGRSWQATSDPSIAGKSIAVLAVDPTDADIAFAGTLGHGLFQTSDRGKSWRKLSLGRRMVFSVATAPANPGLLLAGTDAGVYRSEDGGANWSSSSAGMDPETPIKDIVFDPSSTLNVWAGSQMSGVYHSSDGGRTWIQRNQGLRTRAVNDLAVSSDGGHLYAATEGEGVYRLDLRGLSPEPAPWEPPPTPEPTESPPGPATPHATEEAPEATGPGVGDREELGSLTTVLMKVLVAWFVSWIQ